MVEQGGFASDVSRLGKLTMNYNLLNKSCMCWTRTAHQIKDAAKGFLWVQFERLIT